MLQTDAQKYKWMCTLCVKASWKNNLFGQKKIRDTTISSSKYFRPYENGINGQPEDYPPAPKRPAAGVTPFIFNQHPNTLYMPNSHMFDYQTANQTIKTEEHGNRGDEEWRNIHVMLNCILSMVEKTKR